MTAYQNTGLAAGTSYSYRVRAYNGSGASTYSNTAQATTTNNTTEGVLVHTTTQGQDLDPDGYTAIVDGNMGISTHVGINDIVGIITSPGSHTVLLAGIAGNCVVQGSNPVTVNVPVNGTDNALFLVVCGGGWSFPADNGTEQFNAAPAIGTDGTIYVVSQDGPVYANDKLYALSPADGKPLWRFSHGGAAAPAVTATGEIVLAAEDGFLYVINPTTHAAKCSYPLNAAGTSPAIGPNGNIYVATGQLGSSVYALSPNCVLLWRADRPTIALGFIASPAIGADGTVYIGNAWTDVIYALDGTDGHQRWQYPTGSEVRSSAALGLDGTVYVGSGKAVYALAPSNGALLWKQATADVVNYSPVVGLDGTVYVGAYGGRLYAFTSSGAQRWATPTVSSGLESISAPAVGSDGRIYFAPSELEVAAFDASGNKVAAYPTGGGSVSNSSSPAISTDGRLYIGAGSVFYAVPVPASGLSASSWPKFHRDNRSTGSLP